MPQPCLVVLRLPFCGNLNFWGHLWHSMGTGQGLAEDPLTEDPHFLPTTTIFLVAILFTEMSGQALFTVEIYRSQSANDSLN